MDEQAGRIATLEAELEEVRAALEASEAARAVADSYHRAVFEHAPDVLLMVDFAGLVHACNQTALRKLGFDPVGQELWSLFDDSSGTAVRALFGPSLGRSLDQEHRLSDGRVVHLRAALVPGERSLQVALVDVSNRVALQREVRKARRLAAMAELAAGLAHEINNPLTVLQLRLDLLSEQSSDPMLVSQLDGLMQHVKRVSGTVHALQAVASPSGREETVEAADVVHRALERAEPWLDGLDVQLDLPESLPIKVRPSRLEAVLSSLMSQAAEALRGTGGSIVVRVSAHGAGSALFEIVDDGPALAETPWRDLSVPRRDGGGGRGHSLGLALAWTLVREDGSDLHAESGPDGGARMWFTVPRGARDGVTTEAMSRSWRLLLVDDEEALREVLTAWATRVGHRLDAVASAEEARERVVSSKYDAVIADLRLPGMSGQELVATWRLERPDLARRTVLTSGMLLDDDEGQRFLRKPFTLDRLERVLAGVVGF